MTNKILISICVPMIEQNYEVFIPICKTVGQIIKTIENSIKELSQGEYKPSASSMIYNEEGKLINPNLVVKESGLVSGSNVIII